MTGSYDRDPRLPWGHWMRLEAGPGSASYVDEDGRRWPSIREFFWRSRLNMPLHDRSTMEAGLERIMTVLAARDGVTRHLVEIGHDLYDGEHAFSRFHAHWLHSVGLIGGGRDARDAPYDGRTTPEGRAVVMMLMTTRSPKLYDVPIGGDAVKILSRTPREDHASDEAWLASVEAKATRMTHAFVRTEVGGHHGIALHYRDVGAAMPMVRTTWSTILTDRASRDDLYRWMAERGDRWDDWGDRAFRSGGSALTQHLLALIVATMTPEAQSEPPRAGPDTIALPAPR